jgi:methylamine dehydrogenase heavy chain
MLYDRSKAREPQALVRDTAMTISVDPKSARVVVRATLIAGLLLVGTSHAAPPPKAPAAQGTSGPPPVLKAEVSDVATLAPSVPHRFVSFGYGPSAVIYDGDTGKIEGEVPTGHDSNIAWSPDDAKIYVAETMWAHGNRGTRVDLLSVYDTKTLNLQKEIELPGRALVGMKLKNLDLSPSGKRAFIYNLRPASSVLWVNLESQTFGGLVETPGCALVFAFADDGVSSLCGDGSLATITVSPGGQPKVTHTPPFFDAANDPIFDNGLIDHATATAVLLSYTGLIYTVKLGPEPVIEKPWSIQEAAGFKPASTSVSELAWRPGGVQPIAWHKESGRLFVLMHPGSYWSHIQSASEIWVLNVKTHALVARFAVTVKPAGTVKSIAVTQKAKPQLILMTQSDGDTILDADTGEELRKIEFAKGEATVVPGS